MWSLFSNDLFLDWPLYTDLTFFSVFRKGVEDWRQKNELKLR